MVARDDVVYVGVFLLSIGFGKVVRSRTLRFEHPPWVRKALSSAVGLLTGLVVSGVYILHPIFSVAMQLVLLRLLPTAHLHWVSFLCGFSHLTLFRLGCGDEGGPPGHANMIQMMITLKMVGLALEVKEARLLGGHARSPVDELVRNPSAADVVHYGFTHAGFISGPYFKFRTFQDMYSSPWSFKADCEGAVVRRIAPVAFYAVLLLVVGWIFPTDYIKEEAFYTDTSLLYRLFYLNPVFFVFRMRLFIAFVLSECSCIMAGLGAYPTASKPTPGNGPTETPEKIAKLSQLVTTPGNTDQVAVDFKTVHNLDEFMVETVPTMGEAIKAWNMTVQHWLVVNVYKQLPRSSPYLPKPARAAIVMVVSALWHGVHPGYYLCLCSVPLFLAVEDLYKRLLCSVLASIRPAGTAPRTGTGRRHPPPGAAVQGDALVSAYDTMAWFVRWQWFCYIAVPFIVLRADTTLKVWASVYYVGHLSAVAFYLAGLFILGPVLNTFLLR